MQQNATFCKVSVQAVLFVFLVISYGQASAEVDDLVRQARALLDKGQARQAFDLLQPQEAKRAGDADFDIALGIAANDSAQHTRAVFALERVLSVQPENSRARAELGRALFSVGDNVAARKVLQETRRDNIPAQAAATIDQFLQAIDRSEEAAQSSIRFYIETSLGHDSNINGGPGNALVAVPAFGGLVLTLNAANVSTADTFGALGAGLSARQVLNPRWSLLANVSVNAREHAKFKAFNTFQLDANLGASYRYDKHELTAALQAGTFYVDGTRARDQSGVVGEWTYRPDGENQWSSYLQVGTLSYPTQAARNADRMVLGTSYAQNFRSGLLLFGGAYVGAEKQKLSSLPHLGHRLWGIRTGSQLSLSEFVSAFAALNFERRKYGGPDPLFLATRQDNQYSLNLGLNWVPARSWKVTPQVSYTAVKSNVAISDFKRSAFSVTLRKDF